MNEKLEILKINCRSLLGMCRQVELFAHGRREPDAGDVEQLLTRLETIQAGVDSTIPLAKKVLVTLQQNEP